MATLLFILGGLVAIAISLVVALGVIIVLQHALEKIFVAKPLVFIIMLALSLYGFYLLMMHID